MALTFVGGFQDGGTVSGGNGTGGNHGITILEDDQVFLIGHNNADNDTIGAVQGAGAAWVTETGGYSPPSEGSAPNETATISCHRKRANGTEPSNYANTMGGSSNFSQIVLVFRPDNPNDVVVDVALTTYHKTDSASNTVTIPSVTVNNSSGGVIIKVAAMDTRTGTTLTPAVDNSFIGLQTNGADQFLQGAYRIVTGSSATGATAFTNGGVLSDYGYGFSIAIHDNGAGGPSVPPLAGRHLQNLMST